MVGLAFNSFFFRAGRPSTSPRIFQVLLEKEKQLTWNSSFDGSLLLLKSSPLFHSSNLSFRSYETENILRGWEILFANVPSGNPSLKRSICTLPLILQLECLFVIFDLQSLCPCKLQIVYWIGLNCLAFQRQWRLWNWNETFFRYTPS